MKTDTPITNSDIISIVKLILLLGVVLIHSNLNVRIPIDFEYSKLGLIITNFISSDLMSICVPGFFIISGYLFFKNCPDSFTIKIYGKKLKSRFFTLFIPYILWNIICFILLVIKHNYFGVSSLGLINNGVVNWIGVLEGFWTVPGYEPFPIAFAFWFVRNLIVFCLLTPIVYFICKNRILFMLSILFTIAIDTNTYGLNWFLIGSYISINGLKINIFDRVSLKDALTVFISSSLIRTVDINYIIFNLLNYIVVLSGLIVTVKICKDYIASDNTLIKNLIKASFFIYAFHQCYCSILARKLISIFGIESFPQYLITYCAEFIVMIVASYSVYLIFKHCFPKTLDILCGKRM